MVFELRALGASPGSATHIYGVTNLVWKLAIIVVIVATAVALFVGHAVTSSDIRHIADIHPGDAEGGTVTVHGTITQANDNRFVLQDSTGTAALTTCPVWYKRISLFPGDEVTVTGEVIRSHPGSSRSKITLSVYSIYRNGETITVREKPGKPPWATSPQP